MIIRRTASQIKLVLKHDSMYRVYNLLTEKVTWFRYEHQMTRHYGDNNLLIDIKTSTILNGEYRGKKVYINVAYRVYKDFTGHVYEHVDEGDIVLQNIPITRAAGTTLNTQIAYVLTVIRYLHRPTQAVSRSLIYSATRFAEPMTEYEWLPRNRFDWSEITMAESTRPYNRHMDVTLCSNLILSTGTEQTSASTTSTTTVSYNNSDGVRIAGNANTVTYTAPREETTRTDLIRRYHSGGVITPKNAEGDNSSRYFGIELEIDHPGSYNERLRNKMATRLHNILNETGEYNELVKFENDGSLGANGIEMIFQPMSYAYIKENQEKIFRALEAIDNTGYSSHDAGTCGFHIHVSRTEINNDILDRVLMIFENFKNELIAFSRRNEEQMRWCKFMCTTTHATSLNKASFEQARRYGSINGHGYVINNQNSHTVEFRLFRGTTNKRTFMAAIQLVDNIVSIAQKRATIEGLTWLDIINYNEEYTELKEYNKKRSIYSTHEASEIINVSSTNLRAVVLVRPHQLRLEGDR